MMLMKSHLQVVANNNSPFSSQVDVGVMLTMTMITLPSSVIILLIIMIMVMSLLPLLFLVLSIIDTNEEHDQNELTVCMTMTTTAKLLKHLMTSIFTTSPYVEWTFSYQETSRRKGGRKEL